MTTMKDQELRRVGLKATVPRLKILQMLQESAERHISAELIYQQLKTAGEDVGLATVYRVLTRFEAAGLIIRHNFDADHAVFELNHGEHHDHLVCVRCNTVIEFVDEVIEKQQQKIAQKFQFEMTDHHLNIYGVCQSCRA